MCPGNLYTGNLGQSRINSVDLTQRVSYENSTKNVAPQRGNSSLLSLPMP